MYICTLKRIQMSSKIKFLQRQAQETPILLSAWMEQNGVTRSHLANMTHRSWLTRMASGVYHFQGYKPTLYAILHSYHKLLGADLALGASTSLYLRGYSHYAYMGGIPVFLYSPSLQRIPKWISHYDWGFSLTTFSTNIFSGSSIGVEIIEAEGYSVLASSIERAFLECLHLSPKHYSLMDLYYIMEMLTTLRPKHIQELLELCSSVKVKRLFLFMAEKAGFPWFNALDLSKIDLGSGVRTFEKEGVYNPKYQIIIPRELSNYE